MRAQGGPQKLRFTILSCTGEDTDYPARELLYHSPQTRGWQTPRWCKYPLEILVKLEYPSKIQQIQILSHEYKIATKVEVYVSNPNPGEEANATFKRLGYLSFDSNERSNHQARELKSVHVNVPATMLRLVVHRCHVNKLNIYNQVGLVALNLIGEPTKPGIDMPPGGYLQLHPPIIRETNYYNAAAADVADLNLDIHVDTVTATKIRELARMKDEAVAREDYDEAKRIKTSIDRLKVVGQKIAQLEMRKRAAVEKEDYDMAKVIKGDIDKLRAAGESAAGTEALPSRNKDPEEIFGRVLRGSKNGGPMSPSPQVPQVHDEVPVRGMSREAPAVRESFHQEDPQGDGHPQEHPAIAAEYSHTKFGAYDERPAQGKGRYGTPPADDPNGGLQPTSFGSNAACDIAAPHGWPLDLPGPEPLSGNDATEAAPLEEAAGEYVARAFYSKNWQLRDAALSYLGGQIRDGAMQDKRDVFRTLSRVVQRAMKDKVANVFLSSLGLFQFLVEGFAASAGAPGIHNACQTCLPLLMDKLGDNNPKLRDAAKDSIMYIAGLHDANLRTSTSTILKPIKNQSAWRPVLGVLNILQELVPMIGISKHGDGFDLEELMAWVGKAYNSANGEVRSAAVQVTRAVHELVGPALRKYLPKDINPKIKEQVEEVLGGDAAPAMMAPVPPAAPRAAPKPAAAGGRSGPSSGRGAGGGGRGSAAAAGGRGAAAGAARPVSGSSNAGRQPTPPQPPPMSPPPPVAVSADEPGPYLDEIEQREQQYGPDHPRVAETCSNLAILYNQRGDTASALPLYERALAIYEQAYGPEHPDVAHTLTDLAVLHLEQGNDEVGRPLLERALEIQERALGPDHPDVVAIKDVLNS